MTEERKGNWIHTYTGKQFWALDPRPEEICIEDIAHALALSCRYSGHCNQFYSIAQHSVIVSKAVSEESAFWGLMHDAAEAYITDIPRPIKTHLPYYKVLEESIIKVIGAKYGLEYPFPDDLLYIDHHIVRDEVMVLFNPAPDWIKDFDLLGIDIAPVGFDMAEDMFMERFEELTS